MNKKKVFKRYLAVFFRISKSKQKMLNALSTNKFEFYLHLFLKMHQNCIYFLNFLIIIYTVEIYNRQKKILKFSVITTVLFSECEAQKRVNALP